jgi:hypothetical protein
MSVWRHRPTASSPPGVRSRRRGHFCPRPSPTSGSVEPSFGVPPGSVRLEARVQLPYDN